MNLHWVTVRLKSQLKWKSYELTAFYQSFSPQWNRQEPAQKWVRPILTWSSSRATSWETLTWRFPWPRSRNKNSIADDDGTTWLKERHQLRLIYSCWVLCLKLCLFKQRSKVWLFKLRACAFAWQASTLSNMGFPSRTEFSTLERFGNNLWLETQLKVTHRLMEMVNLRSLNKSSSRQSRLEYS